ncbi:TonB-dependent receptor plug domain-containing protein [Synoicihabitans lomoniglobus]|uniref:TonB-dependent receptor n=1 Tax=Synoicihabitans lomoniglobus TaxID=2909285 RepID=A0AAE9ZWF7_9BACT|nr:TonB-dependent receptor [Opitutaceae bacterium LMO-M01]WED65397.1 TonB-dependent receptor [Opitutaceae bacterium LMO-M01]
MNNLPSFASVGSVLRIASAVTAGAALASFASAQTPATPLDPFVTTATRTPVSAAQLGSAVDVISAADLQRRQVNTLAGALNTVPGTPNFASGAMGALGSIFLRGAESDQTLFLVDGIRLNDPNTDYQLFLGGSCVSACDSLEVSHGPQSTLYGGEAMGGVIAIAAQPGTGEPTTRLGFEAGSFGTVQGTIYTQGQLDATAYVVSITGGHTENDRPNNAFDSANLVARIDHALASGVRIGATLRGFEGRYESPGDRFTNDPDNTEDESNWLATAYAEFDPSEDLHVRVTLGGQAREFVSTNPGGFGTQVTTVTNKRGVLDSQVSYTGLAGHRLTGGVTAEANHTKNDGFGDIDESQSLLALFVQDEIALGEHAWLTLGLRSDDHDTFGRATTGRATIAWQVVPEQLKLRASYGTAFRSPSFLDLYGQSSYYAGNPDLNPEEARGWDVGADFYFADNRGTLSATYFDSDYDDLIIFDFGVSPGTTANVDAARTRGVETSGRWSVGEGTELRFNYTYLDATNESNGTRLLRRPRHSGGVDVWHDFGNGFDLGVGLGFVADREDVHAATFGTIDAENYAVARVYAAWQVRADVKLRARVENALDESYEQVHGFPQPGVGAYAGVEWTF